MELKTDQSGRRAVSKVWDGYVLSEEEEMVGEEQGTKILSVAKLQTGSPEPSSQLGLNFGL